MEVRSNVSRIGGPLPTGKSRKYTRGIMALCRRNDFLPSHTIYVGVDTLERQLEAVVSDQTHDLPPGPGYRESILLPENIRQRLPRRGYV